MKASIRTLAILLGLAGLSTAATVSLQISSGTTNAVNFANAAGTPLAGLTWGVIVDTGGDGIVYDNLLGTAMSTTTAGIQLGGTDDYLFVSANLTGSLPNIPVFGAEAGATGQIPDITGIVTEVPATNPVAAGQAFALIWFDDAVGQTSTLAGGDGYGIVTDAAFVIPPGGNTTSYAAVFAANPDPVRAADLVVVPEPSVALLGALGLLGVARRRRC